MTINEKLNQLSRKVTMLEKQLRKQSLAEEFIPKTSADYFYGPEDDREWAEWYMGRDGDEFEQSLSKALPMIGYSDYGPWGYDNDDIYIVDASGEGKVIPAEVFTSLSVDELLTPRLLARALKQYLRNN